MLNKNAIMQNVNYICEFLQTITSLFNAKLFRMTSEIYENLSLYKTHQRLYRKTTAKNILNKAIMKIKNNRFPLLAFSLSRLSTQLCIYIQTSLFLNIFLIIYKSSLFFAFFLRFVSNHPYQQIYFKIVFTIFLQFLFCFQMH